MVRIKGMYNGKKFVEVMTFNEKLELMYNPNVIILSVEYL